MDEMTWSERVNMLSINPEAATNEDVMKMASTLSSIRKQAQEVIDDELCLNDILAILDNHEKTQQTLDNHKG